MDDVAVAQNLNLCDVAFSKVAAVDRLGRSVECYGCAQHVVKRSNGQTFNCCGSVALGTSLDDEFLDVQTPHVGIRSSVDSNVVNAFLFGCETTLEVCVNGRGELLLGDCCCGECVNSACLAHLHLELLFVIVVCCRSGNRNVVVLACLQFDRQDEVIVGSRCCVV